MLKREVQLGVRDMVDWEKLLENGLTITKSPNLDLVVFGVCTVRIKETVPFYEGLGLL